MKIVDNIREKVRGGLASFSFLCGLIGGLLASVSAMGHPIMALSRFGPWWEMPIGWWVVTLAICLGDWASKENPEPNRPAVFTALISPSCFVAMVTGTCGKNLFAALNHLTWLGAHLGTTCATWVDQHLTISGDTRNAFTALSVAFWAVAILYAQRYAKAKKTAAVGGLADVVARAKANAK